MNKNYIIGGIIVIILIFIGIFFFVDLKPNDTINQFQISDSTGTPSTVSTSTAMATGTENSGVSASTTVSVTTTQPKTVTVSYTNNGFSPKDVTINLGDTVTWVNNSQTPMWVASGVHPTHTLYDGTSEQDHCAAGYAGPAPFDACGGVAPGSSYSFTFNETGTHQYHNHLSAGDTGSVTVK